MLIAFVLCYQVSSGRYTTEEQEDVLEKNYSMQYSIGIKWNTKK